MNNDRNADIQDTVSKLRFLSKIKKGEKLQVKELQVVENNWYSKLVRHWYSTGKTRKEILESREVSLNFIKEVCDHALAISRKMLGEPGRYYEELWSMLITSLKDSQEGILNLMTSYEEDRLYISKVETFISVLNAKINNLEEERAHFLEEARNQMEHEHTD